MCQQLFKVVSTLPAIFWRQQISWSCDAIWRKRLLCQENAVLLVV